MRSLSLIAVPALLSSLFVSGLVLPLAAQTAAAPKKAPAPAAAPAAFKFDYKQSGSPSAKVTLELYTDFECPACREFFLNTLPLVDKDYVKTGKVRLIHRDFPLQQHRFTRIATRYANAAGQIGKYDVVTTQIFQTQAEWAQNGNLDAVLQRVLSPGDLKTVRDLAMGNDTKLDDTVLSDVAMGNQDRLQQTPTIVIVAKGKRDVIGGAIPFPILKSYLDKKLAE